MAEFPNNSKMNKKTIKPVVDKKAETKKKSEVSKFKDHLINEELPKTRNHIIYDILIPRAKQIILDSFAALLGGSYSNTNTSNQNGSRVRTSYNNMYNQQPRRETRPIGSAFDYDDIIFDSRIDAQAVLDGMIDLMHEYGRVSVSDMYELAGITDCPSTYVNWGWALNSRSDLRDNAQVRRSGDYYVVACGRPEQIR